MSPAAYYYLLLLLLLLFLTPEQVFDAGVDPAPIIPTLCRAPIATASCNHK